jgi:hypothetical protein
LLYIVILITKIIYILCFYLIFPLLYFYCVNYFIIIRDYLFKIKIPQWKNYEYNWDVLFLWPKHICQCIISIALKESDFTSPYHIQQQISSLWLFDKLTSNDLSDYLTCSVVMVWVTENMKISAYLNILFRNKFLINQT